MPKKTSNKKVVKKEDSDNEYEIEDVEHNDENEELEELDEDEETDEIDDDEELAEGDVEELEDDEEDTIDNNEEVEVSIETSSEFISKENRVSVNRLTKYEMVRILGERIKQLNMGAKPLIKNHQGLSYDKIAEEEFKNNMIPFKIKRPLPNGKFEIWTLDELQKDHLLFQLE
jgi:DNA-directed RNA polymerase subunit K/omega